MKESEEEFSVTAGYFTGLYPASNTAITTTDGSTFTVGDDLNSTITISDPTIYNSNWGSSGANWTSVELDNATKEELQKIIKNREVQIEIDGVMKKCKLSDLLETGYLTLKSL